LISENQGHTLAFMYSQLSLTSDIKIKAVGGYMTLLQVIFFFSFFLADRKYIFVCIILVLRLLCLFVFVGMSYRALPEAHSVEACEAL